MQFCVVLIIVGIFIRFPESCNWMSSAKLPCCMECFSVMSGTGVV